MKCANSDSDIKAVLAQWCCLSSSSLSMLRTLPVPRAVELLVQCCQSPAGRGVWSSESGVRVGDTVRSFKGFAGLSLAVTTRRRAGPPAGLGRPPCHSESGCWCARCGCGGLHPLTGTGRPLACHGCALCRTLGSEALKVQSSVTVAASLARLGRVGSWGPESEFRAQSGT